MEPCKKEKKGKKENLWRGKALGLSPLMDPAWLTISSHAVMETPKRSTLNSIPGVYVCRHIILPVSKRAASVQRENLLSNFLTCFSGVTELAHTASDSFAVQSTVCTEYLLRELCLQQVKKEIGKEAHCQWKTRLAAEATRRQLTHLRNPEPRL